MESDTIAAIATPPGEGGVGIVRLSGPLSRTVAERLFPDLSPRWASHHMRHGPVVDPAARTTVDRALACLMRGPHSYTGEDVFEIHCHGSPLVLARVLDICLREGCRPARPGEFTLRAFLNGRLDLSQAEAVLDVVRARSNDGLQLAVDQLGGWLSARVEPLRQDLMGVLAHMEAIVDFVEDDIPPQMDDATRRTLEYIRRDVDILHAGTKQGIILREGASLAIVGSPNVGKSSIMNALLGLDRSIVTPIAGTTRDTVEETVQIGGVPFRTVDTAGITETEDPVEQIGVERSRHAMRSADVLLLVLDRSRPLSRGDELALQAIDDGRRDEDQNRSPRLVVTLNKSDLPPRLTVDGLADRLQPVALVESNTIELDGMEAVRDALALAALGGARQEHVAGNARHGDALRRAGDALRAAMDGYDHGTPLDLIALDVRAAAAALGEIGGANVDDELLDRIFREFCIGK